MASINNPLRPDNDEFVTPLSDAGLIAAVSALSQMGLTQGQEDLVESSIDANYTVDRALEKLGLRPNEIVDSNRRKVLMFNIHGLQQAAANAQIKRSIGSPGNPEQVSINLDHLLELLALLVKYREEIMYWIEDDSEKFLNYRSDFNQIARGVEIINTALTYGRKK